MNRIRRTLVTAAAAVALPLTALAQDYPAKTVRIIVGFEPGGGTDASARILADAMGRLWGQTVVVENRTGASGMIAAGEVVKAAPDGYTLLVSPQTSIAVAPQMQAKAPYDSLKDLTPITIVASSPLVLVAHPSFPANGFAEFVAHVRKNPGQVSFASGGNGSSPHMTSELINKELGLKMVHVPYRGEQPAIADVLGNQVPVLFANIPSGMPHVKAGKLKALVQTGEKRSALAPEVPTIMESGAGKIATATWNGLYAPAGMPEPLVKRIYADVSRALKDGPARERLEATGNDVVLNPPERFAEHVRAEYARWGAEIKAANIRAN